MNSSLADWRSYFLNAGGVDFAIDLSSVLPISLAAAVLALAGCSRNEPETAVPKRATAPEATVSPVVTSSISQEAAYLVVALLIGSLLSCANAAAFIDIGTARVRRLRMAMQLAQRRESLGTCRRPAVLTP